MILSCCQPTSAGKVSHASVVGSLPRHQPSLRKYSHPQGIVVLFDRKTTVSFENYRTVVSRPKMASGNRAQHPGRHERSRACLVLAAPDCALPPIGQPDRPVNPQQFISRFSRGSRNRGCCGAEREAQRDPLAKAATDLGILRLKAETRHPPNYQGALLSLTGPGARGRG
jgi:hypothetical protein